MESNNLWLMAITDGTIRVMEGAYSPDLNTHNVPRNPSDWKQAARVGSNKYCTHRELEVFGVAFTGRKVEELRSGIVGQRMVNREGFMVGWRNPGGGSTYLRPNSVLLRLNDLYQWSKHGVQVTIPVETAWDRFELTTGKLMVGAAGAGSAQAKKELEEKEKENQRLQAEKDKEIEELKKQAKEKEDEQLAAKKEIEELKKQAKEKEKENEELKKQAKEKEDEQLALKKENEELKKQAQEKDDQLAAKDKQIANLRNALSAFV
ncbi:unnamed protein product [Linum tenue]|uniref:Uncharacterized protein n=1 Tax=Linum tenue TaxID=586396 RepID=A0AAV0RQY8_9ROSI|nr:unnamed protein product [Linum tenue]